MHRSFSRVGGAASLLLLATTPVVAQGRGGNQGPDTRPEVTFPVTLQADDPKLAALKKEAMHMVDSMSTFSQQMVDMVFSFGELGMQEEETSKYLTGILEKNGFKVTRGFAGIPTAWVATWGSGKPVISLGSDVDDIPQANQKPGVGYKDPMIVGAPGHGEGPQLRRADEHHRRDRGEEDHGARAHPGHDSPLARHRRRADGRKGVLRARRNVQGRRRRVSLPTSVPISVCRTDSRDRTR